jgi:hypothetical protein
MNIELMLVEDLVMNEMGLKMYSKPRNYETMKQSISQIGIIQAIQINEEDNMIISGNLRCLIAKELNMEYVPVIKHQLGEDENINDLYVSSNVNREKSLQCKYNENEYINGQFSYGQGTRVDLSPEKQKEKDLKTKLKLTILTTGEVDYFGRIKKLAQTKYGEENYRKEIEKGLKKIDDGEITKNAFKLSLEGAKSPQLFMSKDLASKQIQKTLNKVPRHIQEEILLESLRNFYSMAS